jgi:NAD(P)-dependent dehydrogenase (short-subunit alcohol dehydrogenase family)
LNEESLRETAALVEARGRRAHVVTCDVASGPEVAAAVASTVDTLGRLDFAINNAGIEQTPTPLAETSDTDWDRIITVDLRGVFLSMKHEILAMGDAGGSIVNISSGAGVIGIRGQGAYSAAKHGVIGLTKSAALDYAAHGIRINAICPGIIETPMMDRFSGGTPEGRARVIAQEPGRWTASFRDLHASSTVALNGPVCARRTSGSPSSSPMRTIPSQYPTFP